MGKGKMLTTLFEHGDRGNLAKQKSMWRTEKYEMYGLILDT
jgi:hypothetical protein